MQWLPTLCCVEGFDQQHSRSKMEQGKDEPPLPPDVRKDGEADKDVPTADQRLRGPVVGLDGPGQQAVGDRKGEEPSLEERLRAATTAQEVLGLLPATASEVELCMHLLKFSKEQLNANLGGKTPITMASVIGR